MERYYFNVERTFVVGRRDVQPTAIISDIYVNPIIIAMSGALLLMYSRHNWAHR